MTYFHRLLLVGLCLLASPSALAASLTWSSQEVAFTSQDSCPSGPMTVSLFNGATSSRTIYFSSIQSPFTIKAIKDEANNAVQLPFSLPANSSLAFTLEFAPRDFGPVGGTLMLFTDDSLVPNPTVTLSGSATGAFFKVDVASLAFGTQPVNSTSFQSVRVRNTGDASLTFRASSPASAFSVERASAPGPLPATIEVDPHGFEELKVSFASTVGGTFQANLPLQRVLPASCAQLAVVALSGTAQVSTVLLATPAVLDFGPQRVGADSPARQLVIQNISNSSVNLNTSSIPTNFTIVSSTPSLPRQLAPDDIVTLEVKFRPVNELASSGTLNLTTGGQGAPFEVPLRGVGARPLISFNPAALNFGSQQAGTTSTALTVTVKNERPFEVKAVSAVTSGPFEVSPASFDLPAGGTYPLQVIFKPTALNSGQVLGSLTLAGTSSEPMFALPLQGAAVHTQLTLTPATIVFGDVLLGKSAQRQITITNPSSLDVSLLGLPVQLPFSVTLPQDPADRVIPANGGSLSLDVKFEPTARQSSSQSITIASNATDQNPVLSLSGKGVAPLLSLSVPSLDFSNKIVGGEYPLSVTLTNSGDAEVKLSAIVEAPFRLQGLPPSTPLGPQGTVTLQVIFAPTSLASVQKSLKFVDDANTELASMRLTGSATGPVPSFSPELELDFTSVQVSKPCSKTDTSFNPNRPQLVTISNSSSATAPLKIQGISTNPPFTILFPTGTPAPTPSNTLNLPAGGVLSLDICFVPTQETPVGNKEEGGLRISYEGSSSDKLIKLVGRGARARLTLDRPSVDFGAVALGGFQEEPITLRNPGELPVKLTEVISTNAIFSFRNVSWPKEIAPLEEVDFFAGFLPTTDGNFSASLQIKTENAGNLALPLLGTGASAKAALSLSTHNFGNLPVGDTSASISVYISNVGTAPLLFNGATTTGDFTFTTALPNAGWPVEIEPQHRHEVKVFFKPRRAGVLSGTLALSSNAQAAPLQVTLQGTGVGAVELLPAALGFGSVNVGDPARESLVTVVNNTVDALSITGITSSNPDEFAVLPTPFPTQVVKANEYLVIPVSFRPRSLGPRSATLLIPISGGTRQVALTGVGTSPELELSPERVMDFGGAKINTPSAAETGFLTVINRGGSVANTDGGYPGVITLSRVAVSGADSAHFEVGQLPLPQELPPGAQLDVPVTFRPTRQGTLNASLFLTTGPLSFSGDGGVSGLTRTVTLTGRGLASVLELSNRELNFGMQVGGRTSEPRSFTLTNRGSRTLKVLLDVEGAQFSHFTMKVIDPITHVPKAPPYELEAGGEVKVNVTFTPLAGVASTAQVRIRSDDGDDDAVPLKGTGMSSDLAVDVENMAVDFGTVLAPSNPRNVSSFLTITNSSTEDVVLTAAALEGTHPEHFELLEQWQAGTVLSANQRASLKLGYRAQEAASSQATLVVNTTRSTSNQALRVSLTGRAVTNFLAVNPMALDFGFVDLGGQSDETELTVTNESRTERLVRMDITHPAFEVEAGELTSPLGPGESATLRVTFHPTEGGPISGQARLRLQGVDAPDVVVELKGQARMLQGEGGSCACGSGGGASGVLGLLGLVALRLRRRSAAR